jgi:hypothetical protein
MQISSIELLGGRRRRRRSWRRRGTGSWRRRGARSRRRGTSWRTTRAQLASGSRNMTKYRVKPDKSNTVPHAQKWLLKLKDLDVNWVEY